MSPQLPNNPSLEGVGIFFDPPDDMGSKPEVGFKLPESKLK